jgi:putative membrane protein
MLKSILVRWAIIAVSVLVAVWLVPGIEITSTTGWVVVVVMAAVLGLVNAIIRPILALLSCGCIVATFGLFMLVINAFTFWLAAWITSAGFNLGLTVESFGAAFLGALVVSVVSFVISLVLPGEEA